MQNSIPEHMPPLVSVIMPAYQAESYIESSLRSILNQTYTHIEVFVIDDASTDGTSDIVERISDNRVRLIQKTENSGYTSSLNMALGFCNGSFIARMDADDTAHPNRLAKQVEYMESNPDCVLCGSYVQLIPGNKLHTYPTRHDEILEELFFNNALAHPSVMMRKSVLDTYSLRYNKTFEPTEDYELWSQLALLGKVHNLSEVYLNYRVHDNQVSSYKRELQQKNKHRVRMNMFRRIDEQLDEHDDILKMNLISKYENKEKVVLELKRRYVLIDKLININTEKQIYPEKVFKRVCARLKKELIQSLTVNHAHTGAELLLKLLTIIPKSYYNLGVKHSSKFLIRTIKSEFNKY
jgi:glycosyltransferase involved in cell wall biosynthesis